MQRHIDFTATFKKLRSAFIGYNEKLKIQQPNNYKKLSLKSTHMETARELIRCYAAHLLKPGQLQIEQVKTFSISNRGVGKNKLQHRTTIYRHILVLKQTGLIMNKVFHGTGKGVELELNQGVLVYKRDINEVKADIQAEIDRLSPKNHKPVASCPDKDTVYSLEAFNINKGGGYVDNEKKENVEFQNSQSKAKPQRVVPMPLDTVKECGVPQKCTMGVAGDDPQFSELVDFYTKEAWGFAKSILYRKHNLTEVQESMALMYVRDYFSLIKHESFKRKIVDKLFNDFCERVILAKRYIDRSPERFIPLPSTWFNRHFRNGFCGTLAWLNKVRANRNTLSNYIKKLTEMCNIYRQYLAEPNVNTYYKSLRKLEEFNDPKLVEYFNYCVADRTKFDVCFLGNYYIFSND